MKRKSGYAIEDEEEEEEEDVPVPSIEASNSKKRHRASKTDIMVCRGLYSELVKKQRQINKIVRSLGEMVQETSSDESEHQEGRTDQIRTNKRMIGNKRPRDYDNDDDETSDDERASSISMSNERGLRRSKKSRKHSKRHRESIIAPAGHQAKANVRAKFVEQPGPSNEGKGRAVSELSTTATRTGSTELISHSKSPLVFRSNATTKEVDNKKNSKSGQIFKKPFVPVRGDGSVIHPIILDTPQPPRRADPMIKEEARDKSPTPLATRRSMTDVEAPHAKPRKRLRSGSPSRATPASSRLVDPSTRPTPPSGYNQGLYHFPDVGPQNSWSTSPTLTEVKRRDNQQLRTGQARPASNPTRNPAVQALVAPTPLDDHNLATLDQQNGQRHLQRPRNDFVSHQPVRRPNFLVSMTSEASKQSSKGKERSSSINGARGEAK